MNEKIVYTLGKPIAYTNFVSYPTCRDVNVLAEHGMVKIVLPEILTNRLQLSVLDCSTNTLLYKPNGSPVLYTDVVANRPYSIYFSPLLGGYVISDLGSVPTSRALTVVNKER